MSQSVTTTFSDDVEQDNGGNSRGILLIIGIAGFIASPLSFLAAAGTYFAFSYLRVRRAVIAVALAPFLILLAIFIMPAVTLFIESWTVLVPKMLDQSLDPVLGILQMLLWQLPISVPLGVIVGLIYSSWRWVTRPVWIEREFRLAPCEIFKHKRNVDDIHNDRKGPMNGKTIGVDRVGNKIIQTDQEAAMHTLVIGASGSGKTTTIMSLLRDSIRRGQGVIVVDLKGGPDFPRIMKKYADRYDRKFIHWMMQPLTEKYTGPDEVGEPAYYDPIGRGDATRRKDLLIASRHWSEEHYKIQASHYIQLLFNVLIGNKKAETSTLADVVDLLNPKKLQERAIPLGSDPAYHAVVAAIDAMNDEKMSKTMVDAIDGLRNQLGTILHSVAGPWLQKDNSEKKHNINLKDVAHKGQIVVFSLDSSNYQELSSLIANLITQDLKTLMSELRDDPSANPVQIVFDEFSAIGSDNLIGLINKSRDANMPVTLSTQALADLKKVDPTFMDQTLGIISSFIIHRANTVTDAEVYAGLTGMVTRKKFRQSVRHTSNLFGLGRGSGTGDGSVEEVEEFEVMPTEIQKLKQGELFYITKSPMRVEKVFVIPEDLSGSESFSTKPSFEVATVTVPIAPDVPENPLNSETGLPVVFQSAADGKRSNSSITSRILNPEAQKMLRKDEDPIYSKPALPARPIPLNSEPAQAGELTPPAHPVEMPQVPSKLPVARVTDVAPVTPVKPPQLPQQAPTPVVREEPRPVGQKETPAPSFPGVPPKKLPAFPQKKIVESGKDEFEF